MMKWAGLTAAIAASVVAAAPSNAGLDSRVGLDANSLLVDEAPQSLRPYVLRRGAGQAVQVGSQIYRFAVTGNSSAGAFTLMNTNAPAKSNLGVLPHIHKEHYENFYCTKGRVQVWTKTNETGEAAREMTPGDYGAVPHNTIHTFQITDPDTQLTGVIQPGGFEALFIALGTEFDTSTGAQFIPADIPDQSGTSPEVIKALESFDVYARLNYNPRRDLVNGSAGGDSAWHNGANSLAADAKTPNFIAKNWGPKYLNTDGGIYRVLAPLATGAQTANNFTMGNMMLSSPLRNETVKAASYEQPLAFQIEEGQLDVKITGYAPVSLIPGDVVFVPADTLVSYHAAVPATKLLYVSGGGNGFDADLLSRAESWDYAMYPITAGYSASF